MKKIILIAFVLLAACATHDRFQENRGLIEAGNIDEGLARIAEQVKENPNDVELRNYYLRHRAVAVQNWLAMGENALGAGQFDVAEESFGRALRYDESNARAYAGVQAVEMARRHQVAFAEAETALKAGNQAEASARLKQILAENPKHRAAIAMQRQLDEQQVRADVAAPELTAALKKPITLEFRDAPLRSVFELISKQTGLNFIFDKDVPQDAKATVYVKNTSIEDVIRFVLVTNQLDRKVLNENTGPGLPEHAGQGARLQGPGGAQLLPRQRRREADRDHGAAAGQDARPVRRREAEPARGARHARGGAHRREADRQPGPRRAGSDDRGRSAGSEPQHPDPARHPVAGPGRRGHRGAAGVPGRSPARSSSPSTPAWCASRRPIRCSRSTCASRRDAPTSSPTRASAPRAARRRASTSATRCR
jgi:hypothetical protein